MTLEVKNSVQFKGHTFFSAGVLFITSLIMALFFAEMFIRVVLPQELIISAGIWRPEAGIGWRHIPFLDKVVNTGEGKIRVVTDKNGYRVNSSESAEKPAQETDLSLLVLGDSFIEALAVENQDTIPEKIREMLEEKYKLRVRAVNAGVGSWQPSQYLMEAKGALTRASYDLGIVFIFIENDVVVKIPKEFSLEWLSRPRRLKFPKSYRWRDIREDVLYPINNYLEERSHLFVLFKKRFQILLAKWGLSAYYFPEIFYVSERESRRWEMTAGIASRIADEFQANSVPVFFVLVPADYQVDPKVFQRHLKMFRIPLESVDLGQPNRILTRAFTRRGLTVIDTLEFLRRQHQKGVQVYGPVDNHFNRAGHRLVAEKIFPVVEEYLKPKLMEKGPF